MRTPERSGRHDINPFNRTEISSLPINYPKSDYLINTPTSAGDIGAIVWRRTIRVGLVAGNATHGLTVAKMAPQPADGMPTDFRRTKTVGRWPERGAQANTDVGVSAVALRPLAEMIQANATKPQVLLDLAAKLKAGADPLAAAIMDTAGPDRVHELLVVADDLHPALE